VLFFYLDDYKEMSINKNELKVGEVLKVLVEDEDEECFAKVVANDEGGGLYVTYLSQTSKVYRDACVYSFDPVVSVLTTDSITEHYEDVTDISSIGVISRVGLNQFVYSEEVDSSSDLDSDVYDDDDDEEEEEEEENDTDSFIDDSDLTMGEPPPDAQTIDAEWNKWQPTTSGGKKFKDTVERIEYLARIELDNQKMGVR
jgi:hypothetical protein